ncbi:MAG: hypothetical protein CME70_23375 [Halobacteriovorax sp.]|nr:hypothetical protein [Halobacteriovorax sp.]|tara:strand:+ start:109713 stop:111248 length:1536 start_codon:yes stop_codon:yes gene_type:complete
MHLPKIVLFILASFFFHLSVNASTHKSLSELDSELRGLNARFVRDFVIPAQKKSLKDRLTLTRAERDALVESLGKFKTVFDELEKKAGSDFFRMGSSRIEVQKRVIARIMINAHGAKLFKEVLAYPAALGVINEHITVGNLPPDYLHKFIMKIARDSHQKIRQSNQNSFLKVVRPRMSDFLSYPKEFSRWVSKFDLPKEYKYLVPVLMEEYIVNLKEFSRRQQELMNYRVFTKYLYKIKVSTLRWLSTLQLPDKNTFTKEYLDKMEAQLMPGDIGVINQDGRLSNLVFTGTWSHGLLYLGPYTQMKEVFEADEPTNKLYSKKCADLKLECSDFISYMLLKFPLAFKKYKDSSKTKDELTIIESVSYGVQLSTTKEGLSFNRAATFRPTLDLKDKAMAIEEAFNNYGKPYDFNFDSRTYGRLVCTELVFYAYSPDERIGKDGLDWFMTVVGGAPAMYGYDVVETYFELPESRRRLEFIFYYESPRNGDGSVREMSEADLRGTVEPDMNRFKE